MADPAAARRAPAAARLSSGAARRWRRRLAVALLSLGLASAAALAPLLLPYAPDLPSRLPPAAQRWLGAGVPEPDWRSLPAGAWADGVRERGVLVAAVRYYPRPAPPEAPTPPEPDGFDQALARFVAQRLGVQLEIVAAPGQAALRGIALPPGPAPDLLVAGGAGEGVPRLPGGAPALAVASAYSGGLGRLAVLRGSAIAQAADLRLATVCVQQGSPYAQLVASQWGATPLPYPSGIHAISGFMAGECQALAEDEAVVERLMAREEWRFYRRLPDELWPDGRQAQLLLAGGDAESAALVDRLVRHWKAGGALLEARERRVGDIAFEVSQLDEGLICHS